ncbi:hypothetical protein EYF80_002812 [Liparis tanakae]|uniref:Uncharacterized protein n=1 Tax=Liparis tanakae TaxID=230148 RepID=A0A4Z2JAJ4_9TELE|nr:hypothetical protein EYF80_002812 [Liparis tanakae]
MEQDVFEKARKTVSTSDISICEADVIHMQPHRQLFSVETDHRKRLSEESAAALSTELFEGGNS